MDSSGEQLDLKPKHTLQGLEPFPSPAPLLQAHEESRNLLFIPVEKKASLSIFSFFSDEKASIAYFLLNHYSFIHLFHHLLNQAF